MAQSPELQTSPPLSTPWSVPLRVRAVVIAVPMLLAALLFFPHLGQIPGVNADEAWVLERVHELQRGARPWNGMTFYVAAMHQYLVWPCVSWFGEGPFAIRLPGALLNLGAVGLVAATAQRLWGARTGLFAGLLLATSPIAVTICRFGIEVPALSPFFAAVAFACLGRLRPADFAVRGGRRSQARAYVLAYVGGVALGALAYNHVVLLPVPIAIGFTMLFAGQVRVVTSPITLMALLGFLFGCSPRLYDITQPGMLKLWLSEGKSSGWPNDILPMFGLLLRAWDGSILYQRLAGGSQVTVVPYPVIAFLGVAALRVRRYLQERRAARLVGSPVAGLAGFSRAEGFVALGLLLAAIITTRVAPHLSIRYAIVMHFALPVLLAAFARPLLNVADGVRRITTVGLSTVIALNVAYLFLNFFSPFIHGGGGLSVFPIGTRLIETSNHFAREDDLYAQLRARKVKRIDADIFIVRPLQMWDLDRVLTYGEVEPAFNAPGRAIERTAVIFYNGPQWHGAEPPMPTEDARTFGPTITRKNLELRHDPSFPPLFRVYIAEPAGER